MKLATVKVALAIGSSSAALVSPESLAHAAWLSTNGPSGAQTLALAAAPSGLLAATTTGLFTSTHLSSWEFIDGLGTVNASAITYSTPAPVSGVNPSALVVGTLGSGIFRSIDGGATWLTPSYGPANTFVRSLVSLEDPYQGTIYFAGTDGGVFRGMSGGDFWASRGLEAHSVRAITAYYEGDSDEDGLGGHDLLVGTNGGGVFLYWHEGTGWLPKNQNLTSLVITALASSSSYTVTFVGTAGGGVYRSDSVYASWTPISSGLTDPNVTALATSGTTVFAGTAGSGVFAANDDGASPFVPFNAGLPDQNIQALATGGGYVFAATNAGVFKRALSEF